MKWVVGVFNKTDGSAGALCVCMCVCVCVCVCVSGGEILLFIYFSGGENGSAQLIFRLPLAYGETGSGGGSLKIENRANGNA